jgi:hypothetical protein
MPRRKLAHRQIRHDDNPTIIRLKSESFADVLDHWAGDDHEFTAKLLRVDSISASFIEQWRTLEARSIESNAYLSPHFVLPAIEHLGSSDQVRLIAIYKKRKHRSKLVGLGVFNLTPPNRRFPLTHLSSFQSDHSYLGGLLVDRLDAGITVQTFLDYVTRPDAPWHGVEFRDWNTSGPVYALMQDATMFAQASWHPYSAFQRAVLRPAQCGDKAYSTALANCSGKDWRRKTHRMIESGEMRWRFLQGNDCTEEAVSRFLALEDRGWARDAGSSLLAAGQEDFFRELCAGFMKDHHLFFTELLVDGEVVASTCNFISGDTGFAFKIGWDQAFAKLKPGIANELGLVRNAHNTCAGLGYIDSGTTEGSFIEPLWPERATIATGILATSASGRVAADLWDFLRDQKAKVRRLIADKILHVH